MVGSFVELSPFLCCAGWILSLLVDSLSELLELVGVRLVAVCAMSEAESFLGLSWVLLLWAS